MTRTSAFSTPRLESLSAGRLATPANKSQGGKTGHHQSICFRLWDRRHGRQDLPRNRHSVPSRDGHIVDLESEGSCRRARPIREGSHRVVKVDEDAARVGRGHAPHQEVVDNNAARRRTRRRYKRDAQVEVIAVVGRRRRSQHERAEIVEIRRARHVPDGSKSCGRRDVERGVVIRQSSEARALRTGGGLRGARRRWQRRKTPVGVAREHCLRCD